MTRAAKPTLEHRPMSAVSIDDMTYLLPFADGQKLVELMTRAIRCHEHYRGGPGMEFVIERPAQVAMQLVMPDQVRKAEPAPAPMRRKDALLGHDGGQP